MKSHDLTTRPVVVNPHVGILGDGRCACGEAFFGPGRGETYASPAAIAYAWGDHLQAVKRAGKEAS